MFKEQDEFGEMYFQGKDKNEEEERRFESKLVRINPSYNYNDTLEERRNRFNRQLNDQSEQIQEI